MLMRRMGIETLYRRPNTSKPAPGHRIYPYLLRGVAVTRSNQAWAMDITALVQTPPGRSGTLVIRELRTNGGRIEEHREVCSRAALRPRGDHPVRALVPAL